jgi:uncharacterized protein (DUF1800 family)
MSRQTDLAGTEEQVTQQDDPVTGISPFANKTLPKFNRTNAGLEPYTGPWGSTQVFHLLRRTTFGPSLANVAMLKTMSASLAVDMLLAVPPEEPSFPLNVDTRDLMPVGQTWVYAIYQDPAAGSFNPAGVRMNSLKSWWMELIVKQQLSMREKMVMFWHNHFVTETDVVSDPRFYYRYLALLRSNAFGNWKDLTRKMAVDGGMLRYLNGNTNTKSSPNENFGRELQELFTIGKGPEVAPGDYTNYTEVDVKAAAKVMTGWQDDATALTTPGSSPWKFTASRHDTANKQFSARYGNQVIAGGTDGTAELNALMDMIFNQAETARYLCRKLYRNFVYYVIDDWTEANIIEPMANQLRSNGYNVGPVLAMLLKSAHFFDSVNMGCMIKSPVDLTAGVHRLFGISLATDTVNLYRMLTYYVGQATTLQQEIGNPPNVAGWPAYYQTPQFYELWINSDTLPKRTNFTNTMAKSGYTTNGVKLVIDVLLFTGGFANPSDPNALIDEAAEVLFAVPLTASQKAFLKQTLIPGLPDYEWGVEWTAYLADPTNTTKYTPVRSKLQTLYAFMMSMPEFQLQ